MDLTPARERERQAAYLYSIIQSSEVSEDGGPSNDAERCFDAGLMFAARVILDNQAGDNDWTEDLYEYADEIRARSVDGQSLPDTERKVVDAAIAWRERLFDSPNAQVDREDRALIAAVDALEDEEG